MWLHRLFSRIMFLSCIFLKLSFYVILRRKTYCLLLGMLARILRRKTKGSNLVTPQVKSEENKEHQD